jgi:alpha-tubulin suppressor-like RCC1 family protein
MKRLLLCLLLCSASALAASPPKGVWYGNVNGYPVMLCVEEGKAAYYYAGQSAEIALDLRNSRRWSESAKGRVTGYWKIDYSAPEYINGTWGKVRGKGNLPFSLTRLQEMDSACESPVYRQTLLVPGEERLSLPLTPDRPAVMAIEGSAAILQANGDLWAWSTEQPQPRKVGEGFIRAALSPVHFLGIKGDGSLWGWGSNGQGQLGGEQTSGDYPVRMGDGFVAIAADSGLRAGRGFSLALRKDGTLWIWGGLGYDGRGNLERERRTKPILLGKSFVSVSATTAAKNDGTLWELSDQSFLRLSQIDGNFVQVSYKYPLRVAIEKNGSLSVWRTDERGFPQAAVGFGNMAFKTDSTLWDIGVPHGNGTGMFGDCAIMMHPQPVQIGDGFVQVALGRNFLLALKQDRSAWTWGWPWEGDQLDTPRACRKPTRVVFGDGISAWDKPAKGVIKPKLSAPPMPANILSIAAGGSHSAMVMADGTLWTWGNNEYGQLALGTLQNHNQPQRAGDGFIQVSIDGWHTLAQKADGSLLRWGAIPETFPHGDIARDMEKAVAPTILPPDTATLLRSGYKKGRGLVLGNDGKITDWPVYSRGHRSPQEFGSEVREIGAGSYHSYAIRNDGSLWELSQYPISPPPKMVGQNFLHIAVNQDHTYGIKANGSLWAWGENKNHQLGDGTQTDRADPMPIGNGFVQVAAGRFHGVALAADGSVWTWGDNETGAIGDKSTSPRARPVKVGEGFARVAAGDYHTLALKSDGSLWAWGANEDGQLGDGTNLTRLSSVRIYPASGAKDKADLPVGPVVTVEEKLRTGRSRPRGPAETFTSNPIIDCRVSKERCDEAFSSFPFLRGASEITILPYEGVLDTACALKNGRIRCARRDDDGNSRWIVEGIHDARSFRYSSGGNRGCALLSDGRVKCWESDQPATEVMDLLPVTSDHIPPATRPATPLPE